MSILIQTPLVISPASIGESELANSAVTESKIGSGNADDGDVLMADGSGGASWEAPAGGGGDQRVVDRYTGAADFHAAESSFIVTTSPLIIPAGKLGSNKEARISFGIHFDKNDTYSLSIIPIINGNFQPNLGIFSYSIRARVLITISNTGTSQSQFITIQLFGDKEAADNGETNGIHQEVSYSAMVGSFDSSQAVIVGLQVGMGAISDYARVYSALAEVV